MSSHQPRMNSNISHLIIILDFSFLPKLIDINRKIPNTLCTMYWPLRLLFSLIWGSQAKSQNQANQQLTGWRPTPTQKPGSTRANCSTQTPRVYNPANVNQFSTVMAQAGGVRHLLDFLLPRNHQNPQVRPPAEARGVVYSYG